MNGAAAAAAASAPVEVDDHTAQLWREMVDNSVECELCNEPYDDDDSDCGHIPRLLTCGHTFCQSCLAGWARAHLASSGGSHSGESATIECPTCRRETRFDGAKGARGLPKNYELVRARQEMEAQTQTQLLRLKEAWTTQVWEKEQLAREAEEHARTAQRESVQASQRAMFLAKQVEINEQEKKRAQELAEEARHRALVASQQAEALQAETEDLKLQLQNDAAQLARVQHDASSAAAVAKELHSKAEQLQQQVDCVRAQLSLHAGRHDPSKLVVLVCEPITVGSWLLPYTSSSSMDGDDALSVDEDSFDDEVESRGSSPPSANSPPSTSNGTSLSKCSSSWSAWGAVSAITLSAAKLVTTTGTALSGIGAKTGTTGLPDDPELELSKSFIEAEGADAGTRASIEHRRKYIDVTRSYQSTAQKGSQLSRAARQQSHHLHRMCELLHDMNKLDQSHARRRRQRLAASEDIRSRQAQLENEDDDMETRAFDERASDVFSAISLNTKNDADCMEYALLEVVRMQTLELGAIEDAFSRVRRREEMLQDQQASGSPSKASTPTSDSGASISALALKQQELATHRRELGDKVASLDPARSCFVLDALRKNTTEMHKLAKTKRKLFQASQQQLIGVGR
ncbi:hypothetical protein BBJ29_008105 [Phytophthora kernoviae]|uniref:RING-type domain-containing protein n=1 Tax=Phytophthora kernoviae TaxID=325452 RepID=A0A421G709_9STRA|nr:hypothetical protein BBJ29_008105 [Phytophthora kernoviae]